MHLPIRVLARLSEGFDVETQHIRDAVLKSARTARWEKAVRGE